MSEDLFSRLEGLESRVEDLEIQLRISKQVVVTSIRDALGDMSLSEAISRLKELLDDE